MALVPPVPSTRLEWSSMARPVKWLIPLFTVVVVLTTEVIHSQYVAPTPYPLTQEPRFTWVLVFLGLIWLTTLCCGPARSIRDAPSAEPAVRWRPGGRRRHRLGASAVHRSAAAATLRRVRELRRPTPDICSRLRSRGGERTSPDRPGQDDRRRLNPTKQTRLRQETSGRTERPVQLIATARHREMVPRPDDPEPLMALAKEMGPTFSCSTERRRSARR